MLKSLYLSIILCLQTNKIIYNPDRMEFQQQNKKVTKVGDMYFINKI